MSTHAGAMLITALVYFYARRLARNTHFTFGAGKLGDLAAFACAIVLVLVAVLIGWESGLRFMNPVPISFPQAMAVAAVGLLVNLLSAWLLKDDPAHSHGHLHQGQRHHDYTQGHAHHQHIKGNRGRDNNLRAAYLHVLADALTSMLALVALCLGSFYGWRWADPLMGIVGALVIARWSLTLIREAGAVLLDAVPQGEELRNEIHGAIECKDDFITDLHIWQARPGHHAAILAIASTQPRQLSHYKALLTHIRGLSHVTVEVEPHRAFAAGRSRKNSTTTALRS